MPRYVTTAKRLPRGSKLYQVRMGHPGGPVVFTSTSWVHAYRELERRNAEATNLAQPATDIGSQP